MASVIDPRQDLGEIGAMSRSIRAGAQSNHLRYCPRARTNL